MLFGPGGIRTDCKVFPVKPWPPAHAAIGLIMRSCFHCWHATSIAVLAVVFFSSVHPTHSAERVPVEGKSPAEIVVIPGPNGLTITSDDLEALDEFEQLLSRRPTQRAMGPWRSFTSSTPRPKTWQKSSTRFLPAGRPVRQFFREQFAFRQPQGLGHRSDQDYARNRLNALLVLANRADQNTVERLLKILDREGARTISRCAPKPRMIAVEHARAKDIAEVLRQVYADRLVLSAGEEQRQGRGGGGGLLPMLMQGMGGGGRGGRRRSGRRTGGGGFAGGGRDGGQNQRDAANRISIGVDTRTNNLVIAATDPLFAEVKQLVQQLDLAAASENETVRVVTLHRTSATAVEKALEAFAGDAVQTTSPSTSAPPPITITTQTLHRRRGPPEGSAACAAERPADNGQWVAAGGSAAVPRPSKVSAASAGRATRSRAVPGNRDGLS